MLREIHQFEPCGSVRPRRVRGHCDSFHFLQPSKRNLRPAHRLGALALSTAVTSAQTQSAATTTAPRTVAPRAAALTDQEIRDEVMTLSRTFRSRPLLSLRTLEAALPLHALRRRRSSLRRHTLFHAGGGTLRGGRFSPCPPRGNRGRTLASRSPTNPQPRTDGSGRPDSRRENCCLHRSECRGRRVDP